VQTAEHLRIAPSPWLAWSSSAVTGERRIGGRGLFGKFAKLARDPPDAVPNAQPLKALPAEPARDAEALALRAGLFKLLEQASPSITTAPGPIVHQRRPDAVAGVGKLAMRGASRNAEQGQDIARTGSAAYHIPHTMKLNETSQVELWIDLAAPVEQLQAALAEKLKIEMGLIGTRVKRAAVGAGDPSSVVGKGKVWVGQHMTASLRGEGFKIEPDGMRGKSLAAEGRARWNWSVTPLRDPGNGKLMLMLEASIDRGVDQDAFPSIQEYVEVELAPWWQRIPDLLARANALLALFGLGLGAVFVYVVKWLRKHWNGEVPLPRLRI